MDQFDDALLLAHIGSGSEAAMKVFYQRYANTIYRFALRTLQNHGDAREVVNEVLLLVWQKPDSFRGASSIKTWLLGITHHKAVDAVRRNTRHHDNHVSDDMIDLESEVTSGCMLTDAHELADNQRFVRHCMKTLSDDHRQVVHLTFFEELGYPDIAGLLGVPLGTVKTRMMHAKSLLMNCLHRVTRGEWVAG